MTTLTILITTDFSTKALFDIDILSFTNGAGTDVTASFASSQFSDSAITPLGAVVASGGINRLVVTGPEISLGQLQFFGWGAGDTVTLRGTAGADQVLGTARADLIQTFGGNDVVTLRGGDSVEAGDGADRILLGLLQDPMTVDGGAGRDRIEVTGSVGPMIFDLADGGGGRTINGSTSLAGIEVFSGALSDFGDQARLGEFADSVQGGLGNDLILGRGGNDSLTGGVGADTVNGGAGNDLLVDTLGRDVYTGGAGMDRIIFDFDPDMVTRPRAPADVITDFTKGQDKIDLHRFDLGRDGRADVLFIGQTPFYPDQEGLIEVQYRQTRSSTVLDFAVGGDVFHSIQLTGLIDLTRDDLIY